MKANALSDLGRRTQEPPISWLMKMTLDHPKLISLAAGFTDNESLPVNETRELVEELLRSPKSARPALQYGCTAGDPLLRRLTAEHLQALDTGETARTLNPIYSPDRLLITHGSQQLLYMVTEALCDTGDIVLVEDPTYFVYLGITQSRGLQARAIRLTSHGLDLAHLEEVLCSLEKKGDLPRIKMLYLISYFQNPTGATTDFETKIGALRLLRKFERAAGHPIYLLEDGAYRELRFAGDDIPSSLAAGKFANRIIYTSTFSKPYATGVRVGYGLLPEPLFSVVRRIKGNHDFGTANLLQHLLTRALEFGLYAAHLQALRARYAHKAQVMHNAMRKHFPVQWDDPRGGLYVWAQLPPAIKSGVKSKFFQRALNHDVLYVPGELCYADDPTRPKPNHQMRLSFGNATDQEIQAGVARLGDVFRKMP